MERNEEIKKKLSVEDLVKEWKDIEEMDGYGYKDIVFARIQNFFDNVHELSSESVKRLAGIIWPEEKI